MTNQPDMFQSEALPLGFSPTPPASPWGINFGGGLNSTAVIVECRRRGYKPDWILFADTGSELPGVLEHVERVRQWCSGWCDVTTVRWERVRPIVHDLTGPQGPKVEKVTFEPLHENCLRTDHLPSKAYGYAGCTTKWKIQPMERWRKEHGFQSGAFAVGYDAGEKRRIKSACERGDDPNFISWYPLVAWGIDREACARICSEVGLMCGKSSCFMCPNMKPNEWLLLRDQHPELFKMAIEIEDNARRHGRFGRGGKGLFQNGGPDDVEKETASDGLEDRCHHAGCFT